MAGKAGEDDIDLPVPEDGTHGLPEARTVKDLMESCERTISNYQNRYLPQAIYNERMCEGEQFIDITQSWEIVDAEWPEYVPKASRNLLRNLRLTWSSRILEDMPDARAWPAEAGSDEIAADVANKYIAYLKQKLDIPDLMFRAAQLVQVHSAVGFKIIWDPLTGPPSPGEQGIGDDGTPQMVGVGEPEGDVAVELVSIFDFGTDGSENIEDAKWCMFWKWMDPYDARVLLRAAGADDDHLDIHEFTDIWGTKKSGVKVTELWWKPDYRFPDGLFAVRVGDTIVQAQKYPYAHGELPLAIWKCGPRRGSPYGSTHVDDAVYIQKVINETIAALWQQARMIGAVKLLGHPSIVEQWEHGLQMIKIQDVQVSQGVRFLEPPNRAAVLTETLDDHTQAIYSVFGLNEVLTGADNVKAGTSARSIAYLNKLDSMKMAGASRSLGKAILRIYRQSLKLAQEWIVSDRMAAIAGDRSGLGPLVFSGADMMGVDVHLEDQSGTESFHATVASDAQTQMQTQGPTPDLQAQAQTGIKDSAYTRSQLEIVQAQIDQIIQTGAPQQPSPDVDAQIGVAAVTRALTLVPQGSPQFQAMMVLLQGYKKGAATAQQQQSQEDLAMQAAGGKPNAVPKP